MGGVGCVVVDDDDDEDSSSDYVPSENSNETEYSSVVEE
jgi:hypothetical protein